MPYDDPRIPCQPWIDPAELCCSGDPTTTDCDGNVVPLTSIWTDADMISAVSNILFARTCYRYPGLCQKTVWPCNECNCGCHPCACGTWSALKLPTDYPIHSIDEVKIDGVALAANDYRLDNGKWLVRMDGERWPLCNSFNLPNTSSSEVTVKYTVGREVPIELKMAASELVCELKKACEGSADCKLPSHVQSITRRGVEMEVYDVAALLVNGMTGIPMVDHALKVHGNCSQQGMVFDPLSPPRGYGVS